MLELSELRLPIDHTEEDLRAAILRKLRIPDEQLKNFTIRQRAIDARRRESVAYKYSLSIEVSEESPLLRKATTLRGARLDESRERCYTELADIKPLTNPPTKRPVIVGTGPCGLFAGLLLARYGWKPILLERGKPAGPRARDVTGFWRRGLPFNPSSNVQFGEGGAGTFSDGKLYTQTKDREFRRPWLIEQLIAAGAPEDIQIKARPHIGTDRLIKVVRNISEEIVSLGGEVIFEKQMQSLLRDEGGTITGVKLDDGTTINTDRVILAVGHSARDTFATLHSQGVSMEAKAFSIGVRIEHRQKDIDRSQYGKFARENTLGSAPYKFVHHSKKGRAAYSFCMCPGGLVVAASSEKGGVATNGMSSYARAESNANSGFMVDVTPADYGADNPLAGIEYQRKWEAKAFELGGSNYYAPAQRLGDFLKKKPSQSFKKVKPSYEPGVTPCDLRECLPNFVNNTLREAIPMIEKRLKGFADPEAVMIGVETRSSSPLRVTREPDTYQSINTPGLYPAGEGAGYAGGIISAAIDGMRIAEVILKGG